MSGRPLPHQILWEARQIAKAHSMFIVEVHDKEGDHYVTAYVLYRESAGAAPKQRLGKRRDTADLLRMVKDAAGVTA